MLKKVNDALAAGIFTLFLMSIFGWALLGLLAVVTMIREML